MSNHSIIEHRGNYHFIKIEEDYIHICTFGEQYPQCKAAILAVLEHWMNDKRSKGQDEYVYMTYPEWIDALYGLFRRSTIIACLNELVEEKLITRRAVKRHRLVTYEYTLNIKEVQERIRKLPERNEKFNRPNLNASKFKRVQKQTDTNLNEDTHPNLNGSEHDNPFKFKRNIDSITETPSNTDSKGEVSTSSEDRNAPANVYHLEEKRQKRDTDPRMKAVKIGENHAETDHSTHSGVLPGEPRGDALPGHSSEARRQDDAASSQRHAQEAGQSELDIPSLPSLDTLAPAQRSALSPNAAVQGANQDKPPLALTARQIKAQNEKREKEVWAIIEAERNTKYTATQRKLYENAEGMKCLIADDISDETIRDGLQALDAFQRKSFTILKFYGWLPNLSAKAPIPIEQQQKKDSNVGVSGLPRLARRQVNYG